MVVTPPPWLSALNPQEVDATSVPSAVAIGIGHCSPSTVRGPAIPKGRGKKEKGCIRQHFHSMRQGCVNSSN